MGVEEGKKWLRINDLVMEELNFDSSQSRVLKWQRGINYLKLPIRNYKIEKILNFYDFDFSKGFFDSYADRKDLISSVRLEEGEKITILLDVDLEKMKDKICFFVGEGDGVFAMEKFKKNIRVAIFESNQNPDAGFSNEVMIGHASREEQDNHELLFSVGASKTALAKIIAELDAPGNKQVSVGILFESFTYEVDDALREWYHPQTFAIPETALAFLGNISIQVEPGQGCALPAVDESDEGGDHPEEETEKFLPASSEDPRKEDLINDGLRRIHFSIWISVLTIGTILLLK